MEMTINWLPNMCLFFHKWGKWTVYAKGQIIEVGTNEVIGAHIQQERVCEKCGLRKYKSTNIVVRS